MYWFYQLWMTSIQRSVQWKSKKCRQIYAEMWQHLGEPFSVDNNSDGNAVWEDCIGKCRIMLNDRCEKILTATFILQLFLGYINVEITPEAIELMICRLQKCCICWPCEEKLCYGARVHADDLENLLNKIAAAMACSQGATPQ